MEYTNKELESIFLKIIDVDVIKEISVTPEKRKLFYIIKDPEFRDYVSELIKNTKRRIKEHGQNIVKKQEKINTIKDKYSKLGQGDVSQETRNKVGEMLDDAQRKINNRLRFPPDLKMYDVILDAVDMEKVEYIDLKYKINKDYQIFPLKIFSEVKAIKKLIKMAR